MKVWIYTPSRSVKAGLTLPCLVIMWDTADSQGERLAYRPLLKFMNPLGIHNTVLDPMDIKKPF